MALTSGDSSNSSVGADSTPNGSSSKASTASGPTPPKTISQGGHDYVWIEPQDNGLGGIVPGTGEWKEVGATRDSSSGSGAQPRNDALTAAQAALSGFLQAQSLADARKLAAMENMQKLGQWAVPNGAKFAPNMEPGGLANTAYAVAGMKNFTPPPLQTRRVNPNDTAGDIPPEIRQMIGNVVAKGGG